MDEMVQPKKGMSKGCMIALIVGVIIVLLIGALGVTCWMKKDQLVKFGATSLVGSAKSMVAENPPVDIDTTAFNQLMDAFVEKVNADSLDMEKISVFFQTIQSIPGDKKVDLEEVQTLYKAIYEYYPELKPEEAVQEDTTEAVYDEVIK